MKSQRLVYDITSPTIVMAKKKGIPHEYLVIESKAGFTSIMCSIILLKVFVLYIENWDGDTNLSLPSWQG